MLFVNGAMMWFDKNIMNSVENNILSWDSQRQWQEGRGWLSIISFVAHKIDWIACITFKLIMVWMFMNVLFVWFSVAQRKVVEIHRKYKVSRNKTPFNHPKNIELNKKKNEEKKAYTILQNVRENSEKEATRINADINAIYIHIYIVYIASVLD